jgi:D-glycero-alpha-D-manno-heptose-7-phosphate kinase
VCNIAIELRAVATVCATDQLTPPDDALVRAAWQRAGEPPVTVQLHSTIPIGAGLGGSSAAGVALAAALAEWNGITHSPHDLAELSRSTEIETLGVAGGCQDHYAAAYGGALLLRCAAETTAQPITLRDETITDFESRAMIAYTGKSRMSSRTITAVLDAYRAGEAQTCDALATMAALAHDMAAALHDGDIDHLGVLLARQWTAQRALHTTITTALIDRLVRDVAAAGALGTKALGASGGGCVLVIARADRVAEVRTALEPLARLLPLRVARSGVQVHVTGGKS